MLKFAKGLNKSNGMKKRYLKKGFTIIELVVVIVVIGILSTLTLVVYTGIRTRAIDTALASDVEKVNVAELKYNDNHGTIGKPYYSGSGSDSDLDFSPGSGNVIDVVVDPLGYCIRGYNTDGTYNSIFNAISKGSTPTSCDRISPSSEAGASIATPDVPTLNVSLDGANVRATINGVTCSAGTTQYGINSRTNDGTWTGYTAWSTTLTTTQAAEDGVKYDYQAQARCYVDPTEFSLTAVSPEATYTDPVTAPTAPSLSVDTVANTSTWSWVAATCPAGTSPSYQYRYTISPSGYDSGWTATDNLSVSFTTSTGGQTYIVETQAHCYNTYATSAWSASGSASYYRPVISIMVIAGGGAGGNVSGAAGGGGGGSGGYYYNASYSLGIGSYTVTVGTGGVTGGSGAQGGNGNNSIFNDITMTGGGGGGGSAIRTGKNGSSGGGGAGWPTGTSSGGTGIVGQGNNGGGGANSDSREGGGGGGQSSAGGSGGGDYGGDGGTGATNSISGVSTTYAGGGGGSTTAQVRCGDNAYGGGTASATTTGSPGVNGKGAGGGGGVNAGGSGGSGIVIISYVTSTITATGGTITTSGIYTIHTFTSSGTFNIQ